MTDIFYNATGLIGVGLIVLAFFLLQSGRVANGAAWYAVLNCLGAGLHIVSLIRFWNLASFVIEVFWISISVYGYWRFRHQRKQA